MAEVELDEVDGAGGGVREDEPTSAGRKREGAGNRASRDIHYMRYGQGFIGLIWIEDVVIGALTAR